MKQPNPDSFERRLDAWGQSAARDSARPMPTAFADAVAHHAASRDARAVTPWKKIGLGLALAASLTLAALAAWKAWGPGPAPMPHVTPPKNYAGSAPMSPYSWASISKRNRDTTPDDLVLPELPRSAHSDTGSMLRAFAPLGG